MSNANATSPPIPSPDAKDLTQLGLADAARVIRRGDITSEKYTAALLHRAQMLAELNSFITIDRHETAKAIPEFLRHHAVPTTFEAIYESLKPDLRESWRHMVMPEGSGAVSADAYHTLPSVNRPEIQRRLDRVFRESEAILLPTTPTTAPLIEQQASFPVAGQSVNALALANHTVSASSVGLPGISLPMGLSRAGLPMGLELDAPLNGDRALLSLAGLIEGVLGTQPMPI